MLLLVESFHLFIQKTIHVKRPRIAVLISILFGMSINYADTVDSTKSRDFPYYKVTNFSYCNGIYLASGVVVEEKEKWDEMNHKIEKKFYMFSKNDTTWDWYLPVGMMINNKKDTVKYDADPMQAVALNGYFVAMVQVGKDPDRTQRIHYSKDGIVWNYTSIHATTLHIINSKLVVENQLTFSVSEDGVDWKTYGYKNWDNNYPQYRNVVPKENQTVDIISYIDTTEWGEEEFPYVSYDWFSLISYFKDSTYVLTDKQRFITISKDAIHWKVVEIPRKYEHSIGLQYANGKIFFIDNGEETFFTNSSIDGKKWKRTKIDLSNIDFGSEAGDFEFEGCEDAIFIDSLLYVKIQYLRINSEMEMAQLYNTDIVSANSRAFEFVNENVPEYDYSQFNKKNSQKVSKSLSKINWQFKDIVSGKFVPVTSK